MSKRVADGQGDKNIGSVFESPEDTPLRASTQQMAGRRIISAKSRRTGPSGFTPGSSLQTIGNPFAPAGSEPTNGVSSFTTNNNNNAFGQSNGFSFAPQQLTNNTSQPFGSQSVSFPTAQGGSSNIFGGSFSAPSTGFSFSAGTNNPFTQSAAPAFGGFGQTNGIGGSQQEQTTTQQESGIGQDMQISPPITPEKGLNKAPVPSIFGAMSGPAESKSPFIFGQPSSQSQQEPSSNGVLNSGAPANLFAFGSSQKISAPSEKPAFSFGQTSTAASGPSSSTPQPPSIFSGFSSSAQKPSFSGFGSQPTASKENAGSESGTDGIQSPTPGTTAVSSMFQSNNAFQFGTPSQSSAPQPSAFATTSTNSTSFPSVNQSFFKPSEQQPSMPSTGSNLYPPLSKPSEDTPAAIKPGLFPSLNHSAQKEANTTQNPFASIKAGQPLFQPALQSSTQQSPLRNTVDNGLAPKRFENTPSNLNSRQAQAYQRRLCLRALNKSFRKTVTSADTSKDWTALTKAYASQSIKIATSQTTQAGTAGQDLATQKRKADDPLVGDSAKRSRASEVPASALQSQKENVPGRSQTVNLFQSILDKPDPALPSTPTKLATSAFTPSTTPAGPPPTTNPFASVKPAPPSSLFSSKPATQNTPITNLFAQPLTGSTSQTSNMFQTKSNENAIPNPFSSIAKAAPPAPSQASSTITTNNLFSIKPNTATTTNSSTFNSAFGQSVTKTANGPTSSLQLPNFGAPTSGGGGFISQFGAKAAQDSKKLAAEAKAKRKAEEFDSDEDDEAEWERKYEEEQAGKKAESAKLELPKFGAVAGDTSNFMSQFGSSAAQIAAQEKAKRKAEEFDSGEDDEEEWERKDAEKQQQKKAKLALEAATTAAFVPGQGFQFKPTTDQKPATSMTGSNESSQVKTSEQKPVSVFASSGTKALGINNNIFGHLSSQEASGDEAEDERDDEQEEDVAKRTLPKNSWSNNLFDRATPATTTEADQAKFTSSPATDHTWKENTPIKFSASPPVFNYTAPTPTKPPTTNGTDSGSSTNRPFAGLFANANANTTTTNIFGSTSSSNQSGAVGFQFGGPPKTDSPGSSIFSTNGGLKAPAMSSNFTSAATSRASSPGIPPSVADSNDGGATDADPDDAEPPIAQTDFTALSEEEKREEEVLFEVDKARCSMFQKGAEQPWQTKGTGPLRVLKNKSSGVIRILQRVAPSGKVTLNTRLNKGFTYTFAGKGTTRLLVVGAAGKPETWAVKMAKDDDAKRFAEVCEENKAQ